MMRLRTGRNPFGAFASIHCISRKLSGLNSSQSDVAPSFRAGKVAPQPHAARTFPSWSCVLKLLIITSSSVSVTSGVRFSFCQKPTW
jgi:hypothetical protein